MPNSLNFITGQMLWISLNEANDISTSLLNGDKFIRIDRISRTINTAQIDSVGPNSVFQDPLVAGGEFSFAYGQIFAKNGDKEYWWNKGWKLQRDVFSQGIPYDKFLETLAIK